MTLDALLSKKEELPDANTTAAPLSSEHSYCSAPFCSGFWTKNCLPAGTLASVTESQWERSFISQCSRA